MLYHAYRHARPTFVLIALLICVLSGSIGFARQQTDAESVLAARHRLLDVVDRKGPDAMPTLIDALEDERQIVRLTAAHLIAHLGDAAREAFEPALANDDVQVRHVAIDLIAETGRVEPYVETLLNDEDGSVRRRFFLDLLPNHLLVDGRPPDDLVRTFRAVYRDAPDPTRRQIIRVLTELPLTDSSKQFLAHVREGDNENIAERAQKKIVETKLNRLEKLIDQRQYEPMLEAFTAELENEDLDTWPRELAYQAFYLRAQAHRRLDQPHKAIEDLRTAISYWPARRAYRDIGYIYRDDLDDPDRALEAFKNAVESRTGFGGHVLYRSILGAAGILRQQGKPDEALRMLGERHGDLEDMGGTWGFSFRHAYAQTLAAKGEYEAAIAYYRQILERDDFRDSHRKHAEKAIEELQEEMRK